MPKFYCEYCSIYLTHSSPAGRKQHSQGRKHINAKVDYYQRLVREQFFQPPPLFNHPVPLYGGMPMMGMMPGFSPFPPNNMPPKMDSKPLPFPPQAMMPPMPPPVPGTLPGTVPIPVPGQLPMPVPGAPLAAPDLPKMRHSNSVPEPPNGQPPMPAGP